MAVLVTAALLVLAVQAAQGQHISSCPVGETTEGSGVCNRDGGEQQCQSYCAERYGNEVVKSECRGGGGRPEGARECICDLRCALAEWCGDPHYQSFDGLRFDYHEICKHVGFKLVREQYGIPKVEMHLMNTHRREGQMVSYLRAIALNLPEWEIYFRLNMDDLKTEINNEAISMPYHYSQIAKYLENYFSVTRNGSIIFIYTSIGLNVKLEIHPGYHNAFVYLARSPQFMRNVEGIFGNFDDSRDNDFLDRGGINRNPNDTMDVTAFGNSWCIDQPEQINAEERRKMVADNEELLRHCKETKQQRIDQICGGQLKTPRVISCLSQEKMDTALHECFLDVCYASSKGPQAELQAACGIVQAYNEGCGIADVKCQE